METDDFVCVRRRCERVIDGQKEGMKTESWSLWKTLRDFQEATNIYLCVNQDEETSD